jgi:non-ribosomal peptide synthetase component F
LTQALRGLSQREGVTMFMTLLAAYQLLLYRLTGQDDLCVGSPVAGRDRVEIEGLIGSFLNLVLRGDLAGNPTFVKLLGRTRQAALRAFENQKVPFELLLEDLQPARDPSRTPLFQVYFNYLNSDETLELPGAIIRRPLAPDPQTRGRLSVLSRLLRPYHSCSISRCTSAIRTRHYGCRSSTVRTYSTTRALTKCCVNWNFSSSRLVRIPRRRLVCIHS